VENRVATILITGANRGIGLEFARQYASAGWSVIATTRQPSRELESLGVRVLSLDLSDPEALSSFAATFDDELDIFIANAGTNHPMEPVGPRNARDWQLMMMVNAIGPFQLAKSLLPRMTSAGKMIAISSGMGSIADNHGGWIPYRTSKAALNMAWSCLAIEAKAHGVSCVLISPGWVKTRMGGAGAEITTEESVSDMRALIARLSIGDSGRFFRRDGSQLAW
jgi:NAD(P)-dependent dehydrogenase (short-subunit alcohol dehydrogenase family)